MEKTQTIENINKQQSMALSVFQQRYKVDTQTVYRSLGSTLNLSEHDQCKECVTRNGRTTCRYCT